MISLCLICDNYPPAPVKGGIEVFTQTLARGLASRGHRVSVVSRTMGYTAQRMEIDQEVTVVRLPPLSASPQPHALTGRWLLEQVVRRTVRASGAMLVEAPDVGGSVLTGAVGAPLVVRMHGSSLVHFPATGRKMPLASRLFELHTLRRADHLAAVSRYIGLATLSAANLSHRAFEVIYNAVDHKLFRRDPQVQRDPNLLLFVGRLSETKGAPNLFCALALVFTRYPQARLRFIGTDPILGSGVHASEDLLATMPERWRSRVDLVGLLPHEHLVAEYQQAAVAVFPSRAEALGIAVLEAMACGAPVVFMSHGPGPEVITHGVDGLLCDTSSPASIAEAIMALLQDPQRAQEMGRRAADRVAEKHNLERFIQQNEDFYHRCLESRVASR